MKKIIFLLCFVIFHSCTNILYKWYGIKDLSHFDEKQHTDFISSIDTTHVSFISIVSDAKQFEKIVDNATDSMQRKIFYQPIQIIYLKNDKIISYHINCYAGVKSRNLDWNIDNRFYSFPPKTAVDTHNIILSLTQFREVYSDILSNKPYNVIVFWTLMMKDFSKNAIYTVAENIHTFNMQDSTDVYLINIDNFFID